LKQQLESELERLKSVLDSTKIKVAEYEGIYHRLKASLFSLRNNFIVCTKAALNKAQEKEKVESKTEG
jgi:hypothetical protein